MTPPGNGTSTMLEGSIFLRLYWRLRDSSFLTWGRGSADSQTDTSNQIHQISKHPESNVILGATTASKRDSASPAPKLPLSTAKLRSNSGSPITHRTVPQNSTLVVRYPSQKGSSFTPRRPNNASPEKSAFALKIEEIVKREQLAASLKSSKEADKQAPTKHRSTPLALHNGPRVKPGPRVSEKFLGDVLNQPVPAPNVSNISRPRQEVISSRNESEPLYKRPPPQDSMISVPDPKRFKPTEMAVSTVGKNKIAMSNMALRIYPSQSPETSEDDEPGTHSRPVGLDESTNSSPGSDGSGNPSNTVSTEIDHPTGVTGSTELASTPKPKARKYVVPNIDTFYPSVTSGVQSNHMAKLHNEETVVSETVTIMKDFVSEPVEYDEEPISKVSKKRASKKYRWVSEAKQFSSMSSSKKETPVKSKVLEISPSKEVEMRGTPGRKVQSLERQEVSFDKSLGESTKQPTPSKGSIKPKDVPTIPGRLTRSKTQQAIIQESNPVFNLSEDPVEDTVKPPKFIEAVEIASRMDIRSIMNDNIAVRNTTILETEDNVTQTTQPMERESVQNGGDGESTEVRTTKNLSRKRKSNKKRKNGENRKSGRLKRSRRTIDQKPSVVDPAAESEVPQVLENKGKDKFGIDPKDYDISDTLTVPSVHSSPVSTPSKARKR
ncbi:uncharacterized protein CANTADRAFT_19338 [Suhomyces tanzawaensis NRRL Y-17324]|uniref:Uncharacterized protein n=1 Tax=Suhomyces tanzawaensis NRRL Y-17324 TaxID=984487 RepID=A0A1E4SQE2_9ASCO|nr:uncharacterized protein CANTADRAFT_19338 [Suhomyces tanzawaensis NRRL Y-17324]ODV81726.1 hypothetical protein CANTADRAFT_19338 [Suhomyces tanzawaensis NRRL Y-17324]